MVKNNSQNLFFPYYVNQGRLLDIFAILNGGYSEYSEITSSNEEEKKKEARGEIKGNGGFKLLNIGVGFTAGNQSTINNAAELREKKVQTISSMLSNVLLTLQEKGLIVDIKNAEARQFIVVPVMLRINSIKSLLQEAVEVTKLANEMEHFGTKVKGNTKETKELEKLSKAMQTLFDGEEIIYETDEYALFGNILNRHLYQGTREDIIGTELTCFAQIKRIYPEGTDLLRNTIFTKIKDKEAKEHLIKAIQELSDGDLFEFEATAVDSIKDKPVYQVEIVALYQ